MLSMEITMTDFPDVINIKILDFGNGQPVNRIAIIIQLFAKHKNDYYFIPQVSDENGNISITRDWLREEIQLAGEIFIMDYSSSLEDCYPKFKLEIIDSRKIKHIVETMESYKKATLWTQQYIDSIATADNYKYMLVSTNYELHGEKKLDIVIKTTTNREYSL